eukprot:scaffold70189_cov57-Phaeocystis_antarctica.AAC.2
MCHMVVTLDVSKLSGWLNTYVPCRDERRAYDARRDVPSRGDGRAWGSGGTSGMHGEGPIN